MRIYPAIDIIGGQCVRLVQGDYAQQTTFSEDPLAVAKRWEAEGGTFLHLVDLDGAKSGDMPNFALIQNIARTLSVPVEVGGGIRTMDAAQAYLQAGIQRVIIGTSALRDPAFVKELAAEYGDRVAVGIDAKDGMVATAGWEEVSDVPALTLASQMEDCGVSCLIYTDIATDGMLQGPNLAAMQEMAAHVRIPVVASGGVSSVQDIVNLKKTGVEGVIVGRALYTGHVDLKEAIEKGSE